MDNLTHSLIGAVLGQAGLKRKTGLAMPALIIAANLPDIDATCTIFGVESLAMRRGLTHGPVALLVLPLLLAGGLILFDRWQARRGKRPAARAPVNPAWLIALCYLGTLTHPAFDWLNTYGIRLLEPLSSTWFYGDALFIIDPWLQAMLGGGIWLSWRRELASAPRWPRPARSAIAGVLAYVALNLAISAQAVADLRRTVPQATMVTANPVPLAFWQREVLVRTDRSYASYASVPFLAPKVSVGPLPIGMSDPRITGRTRGNPAAQAFLFWSRLPVAEIAGETIVLKDQRFSQLGVRDRFTVALKPQ